MPARLLGSVQGKDDFMNISDAIRSIIKPHTDDVLMPLSTVFSESMDREKPWQEYPRPQLVRDSYFSLNGLWDYAITGDRMLPSSFDGQILVPFSPECSLSGVRRNLQPGEYLYYHRLLPEDFCCLPSGYRLLLHFDAVDYEADIVLNHKQVLHHTGGYLPFTADITDFLCEGENHLSVRVRDDTNRTQQSRGKQSLERGGIFYTAQSGIWQSVWMEQVPDSYIKELYFLPSYDNKTVTVTAVIAGSAPSQAPFIRVTAGNRELLSTELSRQKAAPSTYAAVFSISEEDFHPWTPEDPFLYDAKLFCGRDQVSSYFAMRLYSIESKAPGDIPVFCLNHTPCFLMGALDQGYWPEGLYTAPSDEALIYDIQTMKNLGFNMIRKHVKVETARWYYHCDRLGMIVWQDMVNGGTYNAPFMTWLPALFPKFKLHTSDRIHPLFGRKNVHGREEFIRECKETVTALKAFPCISTWVIFNEGWGQFDSKELTALFRELDDTRLIDSASGWFDRRQGDFKSEHNYFAKQFVIPSDRAFVISEYGGYTCQVKGHTCSGKTYGYKICSSTEEFQAAYYKLMSEEIEPLKEQGLCGAVYTQLSDIEDEINGLMTYDREVCKL